MTQLPRPAANAEQRRDFYARIDPLNLTPLWEVLGRLVPPAPQSETAPALWSYARARAHLMESGRLITAQEAERRVLVLENPALRGQSRITTSLYAGLQLILPGEVAPAHRHTQSALRLVIDGEGAYTAVDGERTTMHRGDFIITPAWTFHDHGNDGDEPVVWLDGLDIPIVQHFDCGFAEKAASESQSIARPEGDTLARYGRNMAPVDEVARPADPSRLFVYPYGQTREALMGIARGAADAHLGYKLRFVNPQTGASPMATIGAFAQWLPAGFETRPLRSTDGTIHVCLEGEGEAEVDGQVLAFTPNDVFVVPSWRRVALRARRDCLLFSYSDRPAQQALGMWREERLP